MGKYFSLEIDDVSFIPFKNSDFLELKLYAISDGPNRNGSNFLKESFESGIPTIINKPVLAYYNKVVGDVEEHNSKLDIDEYGAIYYDYQNEHAERPVGVIPESAKIYIEKRDDKSWVVIDGALIWTEYNSQLSKLIKKQKQKKVSVEVEVLDSEDSEDGIENIKKWKFLGITILGKTPDGKLIDEGIQGAHLLLKDCDYENSNEFTDFKRKMSFALMNDKPNEILEKYLNPVKEERRVNMALSHRDLEDRLWAELSSYTYERDGYTNHKYWIEDVSEDDKKAIVRDNETNEIFSIPYRVDDENKVHIDLSEKKPVERHYESYSRNIEVFLAKKDWGTGEALKVDKSKDAVSDSSWGSVNKTNLRNEVLRAKNYKTLVKAVYLLVQDGWEDSPSDKLKYPVMELKDGEFVYNKNGLESAQAYGETNDKAIASKAKRIRKSLGLLDADKEKEKKMKKFIQMARDEGLAFAGLFDGKLHFVEDKDDDAEKKEMTLLTIEKEKANDERFDWDELTEKKVRMDDHDDCDDDDHDDDEHDDDDDHKKEMKRLRKENEDLRMKCEEFEEEKKEMARTKLKEDTDAILSDEDEDVDEKTKEELKRMRDDGKFKCVDDFVKELSYRKYIQEKERKEEKDKAKSFSYTTRQFASAPAKSLIDALDQI